MDSRRPQKSLCQDCVVNITDGGAVHSAMQWIKPDIVVHLAAFAGPHGVADSQLFQLNAMGAYNVMEAAIGAGVRRIVFASTDSTYGFVYSYHPIEPVYLPIDEDHPQRPQDSYGMSKVMCEDFARMFTWRDPSMQIVAIRICHLEHPDVMVELDSFNKDPKAEVVRVRRKESFNYVDIRDAAWAFRLAVEKDLPGFHVYNIAAKDTCMDVRSIDLIKDMWPNLTDLRTDFSGYASFLSSEKATRELGWEPKYSWRDPQWKKEQQD